MKIKKSSKNTILVILTIALCWLLFYLPESYETYFYIDYVTIWGISLLFQFAFIPLLFLKYLREKANLNSDSFKKALVVVSLIYIFTIVLFFLKEIDYEINRYIRFFNGEELSIFLQPIQYFSFLFNYLRYNFIDFLYFLISLTIYSWPYILIITFLILYLRNNINIEIFNNKFMKKFLRRIFFTPLNKGDYTNEGEVYHKKPKRSFFKRIMRGFAMTIFVIASLMIIIDWLDEEYYYDSDYSDSGGYSSACNVAGVLIWGDIVTLESDDEYLETSADDIIFAFDEINKDEGIKAVIIEIDSSGGFPVAAEEIAEAIKRSNKPTVALIREFGNSAAYWVASAADTLFASRNSELGSIGVTMSYLDYTEYNQREGIKYIDISAGKFKDTGDPDKPLSEEERELLLRDTNIIHDNFIKAVAENRNMDIEKVRELADGSTMLGQMALNNGLIDRIGTIYDTREYLEELIGEEIDICWY